MRKDILEILDIEEEKDSASFLLAYILDELTADYVELFFLSLNRNVYELYACEGKGKCKSPERNISFESTPLNSGEAQFIDNRLVFPIYRGASCLGVISIDTFKAERVSRLETGLLQEASWGFKLIYERKFVSNLFLNIQQPINFKIVSEDDFYIEIMKLLASASGIELIALREIMSGGELKCIGCCGFETNQLPSLNLAEDGLSKEFREAIIQREVTVQHHIRNDHWTRKITQLSDVKSFVVIPVCVGSDIFGVLSFATKVEYVFSKIEILGLESIANSIGVAINNYRNVNKYGSDIAMYSETAVAISGLEIAQASRHEAKNLIESCSNTLARIMSSPSQRVDRIEGEIDKLSSALTRISQVLDNIRLATKPPKLEKKKLFVQSVWDQAVSALSGKLAKLNIKVRYEGRDASIEGYPDWLRQAFLNLLLNSVDAFSRGGVKRGGREITLRQEKSSAKSSEYNFTYNDNAGGVDLANLEFPDEYRTSEFNINKILFEPNVTSKGNQGSGWGLFLVRKCINIHSGSIDITRTRGGVTFSIKLPH